MKKRRLFSIMDKMYKEGGLATDGLEVDPISGNKIPTGSNAEDVRDDVDAQLSSGEYIVPADVVKYFGVSYFEKLREKAKSGLDDMDKDGRMGGKPITPTLESDMQAVDGYASGGMVPGSSVDGILDRIKAAATKDPSVSNLLKSKGIFIQQPMQGQAAQAPAVQGQATPRQYAEGGTVLAGPYSSENNVSSYNPYAYTPGFSAESGVTGMAPGAPAIPTVPTPSVEAPAQPLSCPDGYIYDQSTNSCIIDLNSSRYDTDSSREQNKEFQDSKDAWMDKYDYSNPDTLVNQTLTTLGVGGEQEGVLGNIANKANAYLDKGALGSLFKAGRYGEAMANASMLETQGHVEKANQLREAASTYAKTERVKVGGLFDQSNVLIGHAQTRVSELTPYKTVGPVVAEPKKEPTKPTIRDTDTEERRASASSIMSKQNAASEKARRDRDERESNTSSGGGGGSSYGMPGAGDGVREDRSPELDSDGRADFYKGGLVSKPTKKTKVKNKSNKKGLGRK